MINKSFSPSRITIKEKRNISIDSSKGQFIFPYYKFKLGKTEEKKSLSFALDEKIRKIPLLKPKNDFIFRRKKRKHPTSPLRENYYTKSSNILKRRFEKPQSELERLIQESLNSRIAATILPEMESLKKIADDFVNKKKAEKDESLYLDRKKIIRLEKKKKILKELNSKAEPKISIRFDSYVLKNIPDFDFSSSNEEIDKDLSLKETELLYNFLDLEKIGNHLYSQDINDFAQLKFKEFLQKQYFNHPFVMELYKNIHFSEKHKYESKAVNEEKKIFKLIQDLELLKIELENSKAKLERSEETIK